jgi:hypothetical protein
MSGSIPADAFMGAGPATGVSTFLQKLLAMVEDHSCDHLISWTPEGTSFKVHDPVQFAKEVCVVICNVYKSTAWIRA